MISAHAASKLTSSVASSRLSHAVVFCQHVPMVMLFPEVGLNTVITLAVLLAGTNGGGVMSSLKALCRIVSIIGHVRCVAHFAVLAPDIPAVSRYDDTHYRKTCQILPKMTSHGDTADLLSSLVAMGACSPVFGLSVLYRPPQLILLESVRHVVNDFLEIRPHCFP